MEEPITMEEPTLLEKQTAVEKPSAMEIQDVSAEPDILDQAEEQEVLRQLNRILTRVEIAIYLVSVLIVFGTIGYLGVKTAGSLLSRVI